MQNIKDKDKSKKEMIQELNSLRQRVAELEQREVEFKARIADLLKTSTKYRTIADGTYDWEFWLSESAEFVYTSPSCERITGYTACEFEADSTLFFRIIHGDDLPGVAEKLNRKRVENTYCEIAFRIIRRDGAQRRVSLAFHPVYDEAGKFLGIRGSNREITAQP